MRNVAPPTVFASTPIEILDVVASAMRLRRGDPQLGADEGGRTPPRDAPSTA